VKAKMKGRGGNIREITGIRGAPRSKRGHGSNEGVTFFGKTLEERLRHGGGVTRRLSVPVGKEGGGLASKSGHT